MLALEGSKKGGVSCVAEFSNLEEVLDFQGAVCRLPRQRSSLGKRQPHARIL
jgi:hypothetical protein